MKAIVRATYGPPEVLHLEEVPLPNVGDGDVLVRVQAASANAGDWHLLRGTPLPLRLVAGLRKPKFKRTELGDIPACCFDAPGDVVANDLADLLFLKELCEAGKVRPIIDRRFLLSEVSAAVRYVEDGRARGKVVITV